MQMKTCFTGCLGRCGITNRSRLGQGKHYHAGYQILQTKDQFPFQRAGIGVRLYFEKGKLVVKEMADLLCLELVEKGLVTDSITLHVGYSNRLEKKPAHGP